MEAHELMIGNYIASGTIFNNTSCIGKVLEIGNEEREFEQIYCECEESFEWFFKGNYCGIPITEEYLLKFGFEIKKGQNYKGEYYTDARLFLNDDFLATIDWLENEKACYLNFESTKNSINIKFVHQLQNLYFALTGTHLTLK